jgi:archaellin
VLTSIDLPLSLTAGNNPVDLSKLIVSYRSRDDYVSTIWGDGADADFDYVTAYGTWTGATAAKGPLAQDEGYLCYWVQSQQATPDNLLEQYEKVILHIGLEAGNNLELATNGALTTPPGPNYELTLEVKPASGASLSITLHTPPVIKTVNTLI